MRIEAKSLKSILLRTIAVWVLAIDGANGADTAEETSIERKAMAVHIAEQLRRPEYVAALKLVEEAEKVITSERSTPYREELASQTRMIGLVAPSPGPSMARTAFMKPRPKNSTEPSGTAVVIFDVTGSGRVKNVAIVSSSPARLGRTLAQAIGHSLFSPMMEGNVGITRVGYTYGLVWEIDDGKNFRCGVAPDMKDMDIASRICTTITKD